MKHNLRSVLRLTEARTFWVRAVRAWRNLLPDWTPSLDEHRALESMPHEHRAAVAIVSHGWDANDPRWDVLMALLEWERREERNRRWAADELSRLGQVMEAIHDQAHHVHEDHVDGSTTGQVQRVPEVHPQAEAIHADPEPVQQGPGDGTSQDSAPDPDGTAPTSPGVGSGPRLLHELRTVRELREKQCPTSPGE